MARFLYHENSLLMSIESPSSNDTINVMGLVNHAHSGHVTFACNDHHKNDTIHKAQTLYSAIEPYVALHKLYSPL